MEYIIQKNSYATQTMIYMAFHENLGFCTLRSKGCATKF